MAFMLVFVWETRTGDSQMQDFAPKIDLDTLNSFR